MNIEYWLTVLSTPFIAAIFSYLFSLYFKPKIEKAIAHKYDLRLEQARSEFKKTEDEFRRDLSAKDDKFNALRSSVLSGVAGRFATLDKRKLEAVEKLWAATVEKSQLKFASRLSQSIKFEVAIDAAAQKDLEGEKLREFADDIWKMLKLDEIKPPLSSPAKERPFLSPMAWALFSAYSSMLTLPIVQFAAMRTGVGSKLLADPKSKLDLLKTVLPEFSNFIDEHGVNSFSFLIDDVEEKLLAELIQNISGSSTDDSALAQSAKILKAVEEVEIEQAKAEISAI